MYSILLPRSFHLMCNTCILFIFEKWLQIGGGLRFPQKRGGGQSRFWFCPPSNIVSHNLKGIFANTDDCNTTCKFLKELIKNPHICLFSGFFCSMEQFFALFWATISILSKNYSCINILLLQSFHLMCDTCIFSKFEKIPQMGEVGEIGAPQKRGASQIWVWPSFKYCYLSSKEHLYQFWCLYHYLQILAPFCA